VEQFGGEVGAEKVVARCFAEENTPCDMEERTRLYEAAGRLAGAVVVERMEQTLKKRSWRRFGAKEAGKSEKLLAVAALRFADDKRAVDLLEALSKDAAPDVSSEARRALEARNMPGDERSSS
jgi:hypothetical protein